MKTLPLSISSIGRIKIRSSTASLDIISVVLVATTSVITVRAETGKQVAVIVSRENWVKILLVIG
jgi:hypothetical protein